MLRQAIAALPLLALGACAPADDPWVVRPPGGGTGGTGMSVDAAVTVDATGDGGAGLSGVVCVVTDLRQPEACPIIAAATDVLVRRAGDATGVSSDANARFTLAVTDPIVILDVGSGSSTLQPALVPVANDGRIVHAPVPTAAAWSATVAALVPIAPGNGAIAIYTETALGAAAAGVLYALPVGATSGPFYDGATATAWTVGGGTGPSGATLVLDLPPGSYQLDGSQGARQLTLTGVPVAADTVTFIRGRLPP